MFEKYGSNLLISLHSAVTTDKRIVSLRKLHQYTPIFCYIHPKRFCSVRASPQRNTMSRHLIHRRRATTKQQLELRLAAPLAAKLEATRGRDA
jgi:hypothetical protein